MLLHPSPGEGAQILLVMQLDVLPAAPHEFVRYLLVGYREIEDIGLDGGCASCLGDGTLETGLDEPALVSLPDVSLVGELVELSSLYPVAEHEVEFEIDEHLTTEFMSRVDYGDLGNSWTFQQCLLKVFNEYFGLKPEDMINEVKDKLQKKNLKIEPQLSQEIVVNAHFKDLDQISHSIFRECLKKVQKLFSKTCVDILREQSDDDAKISNIARSFGTLKSALRLWFKNYAFRDEDDDARYRIFLADIINGGPKSIFKELITNTLKSHYPLRVEYIKKRREQAEQQETTTFKILETYAYSDDYEAIEMKRCLLTPFYLRKEYLGRENELNFANYLDQRDDIEWWMKNGDSGRDYLSIRYFNTVEERTDLFYPDWIYKKKDGTIGIWDTKDGQTARSQETKDKAEELQRHIQHLNGYNREFIRYEGGIVMQANGMWYYNSNDTYTYKKGSTEGWKNMNDLFK